MRTIRRIASCVVGTAAFLSAVPCAAQQTLSSGSVVRGAVFGQSSPWGIATDRFECFLLPTNAGESWRIETTGSRFVRLSQSCAARGPAIHSASGSDLTFVSGGGTYFVVIGTFEMPGSASAAHTYSISARHVAGGGRRMAAGATILMPAAGVASAPGGSSARTAGEVFTDCPSCPRMAVLPAGSFMMGSPEDEDGREAVEGPRHVVTLPSAFAMGVLEVTYDQYDACTADGACPSMGDGGWGRGARPVVGVTWLDAQRYIGWLSQKTGQRYFLPTEAEWEYAARAGNDTPWNTGSAIIGSDANILGQFGKTVPAGSYPANAFGLHDMHGNVAEWTQDCMDVGYFGAPTDGSAAAGDCSTRTVVRGGSHASLPVEARSASRLGSVRSTVSDKIGFRVSRAL